MVYPKNISDRIGPLCVPQRTDQQANAQGAAANFDCGSFVRFFVHTDDNGAIDDIRFETNGCGYMAAAAHVLADNIRGNALRALHGLQPTELASDVENKLDAFPRGRRECLETAIEAVRNAFADLRRRQVEEFHGEKPLICTCFGVTEDRIVGLIKTQYVRSVGEVTEATNAGSGCGSCRMLIQEILDHQL